MAAEPPQKRPATRSSSSSSIGAGGKLTREQKAAVDAAVADLTRNLVVEGRKADSEPQSQEWRPPLFWALYLDGLMSYEPEKDPTNPFTKSGKPLATSLVDEIAHERNDPQSEFPWSTIIAICSVEGNLYPELYPGVVYPNRAPTSNAGDSENEPLPSNMRRWTGVGSERGALPSVVTAIRNAQDFRDAMVREMIAQNIIWPDKDLEAPMVSLLSAYARRMEYGTAKAREAERKDRPDRLPISMIRLGRPVSRAASRAHSRRPTLPGVGVRGVWTETSFDLMVALANIVFENSLEMDQWIERFRADLGSSDDVNRFMEKINCDHNLDRLWVVARQWLQRNGLEDSVITDIVGTEERRGIQMRVDEMERNGVEEKVIRRLRATLPETPLLDSGLRGFIRFVEVERFDSPIKQAMYVVFYQPAVEPALSVWCATPATVFSITAGPIDEEFPLDWLVRLPYSWFVRNAPGAVKALKERNREQTSAVAKAFSDLRLSDAFNAGQHGPLNIIEQYGYLPTTGEFRQ